MAAYGDGSRALRYTPLLLGHSPETPHQWDREHHQTQTHSKARSRARQQDRIESLDYTLQEPVEAKISETPQIKLCHLHSPKLVAVNLLVRSKWLSWFNWLVFLGLSSFSRADLVGLVLTCWFPMVNQCPMG
jgi:hypothetical protein